MPPMSKKNKATKKHKFKHVEQVTQTGAPLTSTVDSSSDKPLTSTSAPSVNSKSRGTMLAPVPVPRYFTNDLRRLGIMVLGLTALELALWYLIDFTPLGDGIYRYINI